MDGAVNANDLTLGVQWIHESGREIFVVPGNQDVGGYVIKFLLLLNGYFLSP